jgi:hypothetical protein
MILTREQIIFVAQYYFHKESHALCQEALQELFSNDSVEENNNFRHDHHL